MSAPDENRETPSKGRGMKGVLIGLLAAILFGTGGFYAAYSGMIDGKKSKNSEPRKETAVTPEALGIGFVKLDPLVISVAKSAINRHLRFSAQLEVEAASLAEVTLLKPRVMDTLIGYLRAVDARDIEDPAALERLRAQMLRRVQVVTGKGKVRDLLVSEFVLD